jgi:protease I
MLPVLFFVEDNFEDLELFYPKIRLEEEQILTFIAGPEKNKTYYSKHRYPIVSDLSFQDCEEKDYSALVIPGGFAPDRIRRHIKALELVQLFHKSKKPIAFICHGGSVAISAKILNKKKVTGTYAIKDDLENAGAHFEDKAIVIDHNLISSRTPKDLPVFAKALLKLLQKK